MCIQALPLHWLFTITNGSAESSVASLLDCSNAQLSLCLPVRECQYSVCLRQSFRVLKS